MELLIKLLSITALLMSMGLMIYVIIDMRKHNKLWAEIDAELDADLEELRQRLKLQQEEAEARRRLP